MGAPGIGLRHGDHQQECLSEDSGSTSTSLDFLSSSESDCESDTVDHELRLVTAQTSTASLKDESIPTRKNSGSEVGKMNIGSEAEPPLPEEAVTIISNWDANSQKAFHDACLLFSDIPRLQVISVLQAAEYNIEQAIDGLLYLQAENDLDLACSMARKDTDADDDITEMLDRTTRISSISSQGSLPTVPSDTTKTTSIKLRGCNKIDVIHLTNLFPQAHPVTIVSLLIANNHSVTKTADAILSIENDPFVQSKAQERLEAQHNTQYDAQLGILFEMFPTVGLQHLHLTLRRSNGDVDHAIGSLLDDGKAENMPPPTSPWMKKGKGRKSIPLQDSCSPVNGASLITGVSRGSPWGTNASAVKSPSPRQSSIPRDEAVALAAAAAMQSGTVTVLGRGVGSAHSYMGDDGTGYSGGQLALHDKAFTQMRRVLHDLRAQKEQSASNARLAYQKSDSARGSSATYHAISVQDATRKILATAFTYGASDVRRQINLVGGEEGLATGNKQISIDVHGFNRQEACHLVDGAYSCWKPVAERARSYRRAAHGALKRDAVSPIQLKIITGVGNHSRGQAVLYPTLLKHLQSKGIAIVERGTGYFCI